MMTQQLPDVDVVVLGTGVAGLTAAVTAAEGGAEVALFEKAQTVGGTSAWSGGMVWMPNNPHMPGIERSDSTEDGVAYLMSLSNGMVDLDIITRLVEAGPEMVDFLESKTPVKFYAIPDFPDYHPEQPGGKPRGGRTMECYPFSFGELGDWADTVQASPYLGNPHFTVGETALGQGMAGDAGESELRRRQDNDERGMGGALVGRLLRGCLDRGIQPRTGHRATDLIVDARRVTGVEFQTASGPVVVRARRGVVIATGGFEWNRDHVRAFMRGPMTHPVSVRTNTGDGLAMAMKVGAQLGNMREAWWIPVADVPTEVISEGQWLLGGDRTLPRTIMVNGRGERFTNEALNYNAFGAAFHEIDPATLEFKNLPCWMVFDQEYYRRYGFVGATFGFAHGETAPDWITSAPSIPELAHALGIPATALDDTVKRWNGNVADRHDPDFARGVSAHDRYWGDPAARGDITATLGPIDQPPYYAVEVNSGSLGTKGGPRCDVDARVLDTNGTPIPGLYAAGNAMSGPTGMAYGGAGGTLGPAMVFGYLAGRHVSNRNG